MNEYNIHCPRCSQSFSVVDEYSGRQTQCPECQSYFTIPSRNQVLVLPNKAPQAAVHDYRLPQVPKWYKSLTIMGPVCALLLLLGSGAAYWIINNRTVVTQNNSYQNEIVSMRDEGMTETDSEGDDSIAAVVTDDPLSIRGIPLSAVELNGHYYQYYPSDKNWSQSAEECKQRGGHLATANTQMEHHLISLLALDIHAWIGGNNLQDGEKWRWLDGTEITDNWNYFDPDQPEKEKYLIVYQGLYQTYSLHVPHFVKGYICEWDSDEGLPRLPPVEGDRHENIVADIPEEAISFNNHQYLVIHEKNTWYMASQICQKMGGRLLSIDSKEEMDFVSKLVADLDAGIWLNASNLHSDNQWQWQHNRQPVLFDILPDFTKNEGGYLSLSKDGDLVSRNNPNHGMYGHKYVCEWDAEE